MMRDALRALHVVPDFRRAIVVHLVESSARLAKLQRETLSNSGALVHWHGDLTEVPPGPVIVLANEFVDALPVHQMVRQEQGWHERVVAIDTDGHLAFGVASKPLPHFDRILPRALRDAAPGSIFEWRADNVAHELGRRVRDQGAALIVDYGHYPSAIGDTLQAVRGHAFADPLASPGNADITAHVDFQAFGQAAESLGARVHGPVEQGDFLIRLGIEARAQALMAAATPDRKIGIEAALLRLIGRGRTAMGRLFKVMALADPALGALPAFET